jgi:hypothetical protein
MNPLRTIGAGPPFQRPGLTARIRCAIEQFWERDANDRATDRIC